MPPASGEERERSLGVPPRAWLIVAASVVGVTVLATQFDGLPTEPSDRPTDPQVTLDDTTSDVTEADLDDEQEERLRREADPDRLRCEPRGCERWRLDLADLGLGGHGNLVMLDDDLAVINAAAATPSANRGEGPALIAIDALTGEERWRLSSEQQPRDDDWARLLPIDGGVLFAEPGGLTAIDADGSVRWRSPTAMDDVQHLSQAQQFDDTIVLVGYRLDGDGFEPELPSSLVGVAAATGEIRWRADGLVAATASLGIVLGTDPEGRLARLEPSTGEPLWFGPAEPLREAGPFGSWVLAHTAPDGSGEDAVPGGDESLVLDPDTGRQVARLPGRPTSSIVPHDGDGGTFFVTGRPTEDELDGGSTLLLVHLGDDGALAWTEELGTHRDPWDCCSLDGEDGEATVALPDEIRSYDLATGQLLRTREPEEEEEEDSAETSASWMQLSDDLEYRGDANLRAWDLRTARGEIQVRSGQPAMLVSLDPPVFSSDDGDELLGIELDVESGPD